MPMPGRIEGAINGEFYEVWHRGRCVKRIPLAEARADKKFRKAVERNKWQSI